MRQVPPESVGTLDRSGLRTRDYWELTVRATPGAPAPCSS